MLLQVHRSRLAAAASMPGSTAAAAVCCAYQSTALACRHGEVFVDAWPCAEWLAATTGRPISSLRVSVGRDPRLSSPLMAASLAAGLAAAGASVARFGPCTTPAMFMSCILPGALGALWWGGCMPAGEGQQA